MNIKSLVISLIFLTCVVSGYGQVKEDFSLVKFPDQIHISESNQFRIQNDTEFEKIKSPLSGISLKFGWLASPEFRLFREFWLAGIAVDFSLANILSIGIEALPNYRTDSGPGYKFTTISTFGFVNGKIGLSFSKLTFFAGGGPGIQLLYTRATINSISDSSLSSNITYHILGGIQLNLGSLRLFVELNMIHFKVGDLRTEAWDRYLMFGIRF
ncbi:hypothetical protein ACFLT9_02440 [Acidobacteriota bacterium]